MLLCDDVATSMSYCLLLPMLILMSFPLHRTHWRIQALSNQALVTAHVSWAWWRDATLILISGAPQQRGNELGWSGATRLGSWWGGWGCVLQPIGEGKDVRERGARIWLVGKRKIPYNVWVRIEKSVVRITMHLAWFVMD